MPYADPERGRKRKRDYQKTPEGKAAHQRAVQAYRERNREKFRAHNVINKAISRGKLIPFPCEVCGAKAEAHHPDYSKPLDVIWLCDPHHKEVHAAQRNSP